MTHGLILLGPKEHLVHIFLLAAAELQEPDPSSQAYFKPLLELAEASQVTKPTINVVGDKLL